MKFRAIEHERRQLVAFIGWNRIVERDLYNALLE